MSARYTLPQHPAFSHPLSREDLYTLVARGSLARGEMCLDEITGFTHTVGELVSGMRRPSASTGHSRLARPAYREISPDMDLDFPAPPPVSDDDDDPDDDDDEDADSPADADADPDAADEDKSASPEAEDAEADDESAAEEAAAAPAKKPAKKRSSTKKRDFGNSPSGEIILHHAHPSWLGYPKAVLLFILLIVAAALLCVVQAEYAIIAVLCAISTLIVVGISRYSRDYIVTRERVELIWGLIGRSSKEARICDIRSIDVYESGLKGLLGLGTIDFSTAANAGIEVQFKDMRKAHEVKDLVRKLQRGGNPSDD